MDRSYGSWTLDKLRDELKKRGVKTSGRKGALVERLEFLDQMGRKQAEELEKEYKMTLPDVSTYKDIHSGLSLPDVKFCQLTSYFALNNKTIEPKIREMYSQRFIRYLRVTTLDHFTYFTGSVWAEMKKSVAYKVDFSVDSHGVIQEAQCDCPVGQGPSAHCKHVACAMFAVCSFSSTGEILNEQTCTQVLQSFHRVKPHKGSPLKAIDLQNMRGQNLQYDPRPLRYRSDPSYQSTFRSTVLNYQGNHREKQMPVLQLFKPANMYAVNHDHDYISSLVENFLTEAKLHTISVVECAFIERKTRGQAGNPLWKAERRLRLTASLFGKICKATERRDMKQLAKQILNPPEFRSKATDYGRQYEGVAVTEFEKLFGPSEECGLFVSKEYPWLGASPDRVVNNDSILEVKCPFSAKDQKVTDITIPYLKRGGSGLELSKKHDYYYQVQGQLMCTGRSLCYFCVFTQKDCLVLRIGKDDKFLSSMVSNLNRFYEQYFQPALLEKYVFHNADQYF